jgi:hypothetical protein
MIDDCTSEAKDLTPEETVSIARSEAFAGSDGEEDKFGWIRAAHRGQTLKLSLKKAELKVQGSLATFAKGHNLHLLTYSELQLAVPALAAAVGLPMARLRLVGLEIALDLDSTTSPQQLLETLQHHKGSKFEIVLQRKGVARPMEYVASHADYSMKIYNKGLWEAQHDNYLPAGQHRARVEVVMTRARPIDALLNRSETTLADLVTLEFYAAAAAHLEQKWKEIVRTKPLTFAGLNGKDSLLLGAGGNPEYWRGLKRDKSLNTFKRHKKRYDKLIEYSASRLPPDEYEQQFSVALAALLAPVLAVQNDTILHTFSPVEISPLRIERAAAAPSLVNDASGGDGASGGGLPASSPCQPADDDAPTAARWPDLTNRNSSPGPHDHDDSQHDDDDDHDETGARRWPHLPNRYASSSPHGNEATPVAALVDGVADDHDEREPLPPAARRCHTCGRVLTSTSSRAKFCSELEWGAAAKKCRNADSNPRNNAAATRRKTKSRGPQLFDDSPFVRVPEHYRAFVLAAA